MLQSADRPACCTGTILYRAGKGGVGGEGGYEGVESVRGDNVVHSSTGLSDTTEVQCVGVCGEVCGEVCGCSRGHDID